MNIDNSNSKLLNDFYNYLLVYLNYSIGTAEEYYRSILFFFKFLKEFRQIDYDIKDFNIFIILSVTSEDIISFMIFLNIYRSNNANTRNVRLKALRAFYNYIFNEYNEFCKEKNNPINGIVEAKVIKRIPRYLGLKDAKKIMTIFNEKNSREPIRNNLIIRFFLNLGLRKSELININISDIDFNEKSIRIIGKGNKERTLFFSENFKKYILQYLKQRKINNFSISEPLFVSRQNKRFSRRTINVIIENAYKLMGLANKDLNVHTLRHTAATLMYLHGNKDIRAIQVALGHESISSTEIYTHVENPAVKKAINSNPLANYYKKERGKKS